MSRSEVRLVALALLVAAAMTHFYFAPLVRRSLQDLAAQDLYDGLSSVSDLHPVWIGTQYLLVGRDPYSADATREIQIAYYGRPTDARRPGDPRDQHRFAYPAYTCFLVAPFTGLPYPMVQRIFWLLLAALTATSAALWMSALDLRFSPGMRVAIITLTLGSYPALEGLYLHQLGLLVCALIAGAAAAVAKGRHAVAGVLLGLATIKPQWALPMAAWFLLWAATDWGKRKLIAQSFAATCAGLILGAAVLQPDWPARWWETLHAYRQYTAGTLTQITLGNRVGLVVAVALVVATGLVCWRLRRAAADSDEFRITTLWVAAVSVLVVPSGGPVYNQLLLLPTVLWAAQRGRSIAAGNVVRKTVFATAGLLVMWSWLVGVPIALADLVMGGGVSDWRYLALPLRTTSSLPFGLLAVAALMLRETLVSRGAATSTPPR